MLTNIVKYTSSDGAINVEVKPHVMTLIRDVCGPSVQNPHTVAAIKFIRIEFNIGLKDAKDLVDEVRDSYRVPSQW